MKVSVIVPTYNRAHMIAEAIDSVLNQTFKDFELIVVDNYSSDNTESVVKSYNDNRIRYFKNQNNGLVSINRNYGIEKSYGEYIAFLDDDDLWLPEKLEKQVELLDLNNGLGLVYSDSYVIDRNGNLREHTYFYGRKPVAGNALNELLQNNPIPLLTIVVKKEALNKVGVFNPRYKIAQDYDLWLRIAEYYPIDFMEQPLTKFRVHSESSYQRNIVISYEEELQIMDYWLARINGEGKRVAGRIKKKKANLYLFLMSCHFKKHERRKALRESASLIMLFPYSLGVVPLIMTGLRHYLRRR